jgi:hypothetical protein
LPSNVSRHADATRIVAGGGASSTADGDEA